MNENISHFRLHETLIFFNFRPSLQFPNEWQDRRKRAINCGESGRREKNDGRRHQTSAACLILLTPLFQCNIVIDSDSPRCCLPQIVCTGRPGLGLLPIDQRERFPSSRPVSCSGPIGERELFKKANNRLFIFQITR